jgi:hypothetical protein
MSMTTVIAFFLIFFLGALGYRALHRWQVARRIHGIRERGRAAEEVAESWLRRHGFTVDAGQSQKVSHLVVDGIPHAFRVRADFVVRDPKGQRAIVEVKTGAATNPVSPATRRQIFEYAAVYGVSSVYLFDGGAQELRKVSFNFSHLPLRATSPIRLLGIGFGLGICAAVIIRLLW